MQKGRLASEISRGNARLQSGNGMVALMHERDALATRELPLNETFLPATFRERL